MIVIMNIYICCLYYCSPNRCPFLSTRFSLFLIDLMNYENAFGYFYGEMSDRQKCNGCMMNKCIKDFNDEQCKKNKVKSYVKFKVAQTLKIV